MQEEIEMIFMKANWKISIGFIFLLISLESFSQTIGQTSDVQIVSKDSTTWRFENNQELRVKGLPPFLIGKGLTNDSLLQMGYLNVKYYATGDGKVIESGWSGGFGNCIVIEHGFGMQSTYGHLSNIRVPLGMNVKLGDLIGLSGNSGTSSGAHLHYQIEKFGKHAAAINFFNNDVTSEEYSEMIQAFGAKSKFR